MQLEIEFQKSKSKNYNRVLQIAKSLPFTKTNNENVSIYSNSLVELAYYNRSIESIITMAEKWKGFSLSLNHKSATLIDYWNWKEKQKSDSLYGAFYTRQAQYDERLPFPIVHYSDVGTFLSFSTIDENCLYLCSCEKNAVYQYLNYKRRDKSRYGIPQRACTFDSYFFSDAFSRQCLRENATTIDDLHFKQGICFRCNNVKPRISYGSTSYGTQFMDSYGWYVKQKQFEYGTYDVWSSEDLRKDLVSLEIVNLIEQRDAWLRKYANCKIENLSDSQRKESYRIQSSINLAIHNAVENDVRIEFGFKRIGEQWYNETIMYHIVKQMFSNCTVKMHYRPKWLEGLELDVCVLDEKIGFQYQGIQHFIPIAHWGGQAQLKKQKEHDNRKKKLCEQYGYTLITVDYNELLSDQLIKQKLQNAQILYNSNKPTTQKM